MKNKKISNDYLKYSRMTSAEMAQLPRLPIAILAEDIRSVHNVGSIFRTADGFGADRVVLTGISPVPPRDDLAKTALGAEKAVPWQYFENSSEAAQVFRQEGFQLVALEQTEKSEIYTEFHWQFPVCFVLGNEVNGISQALVEYCDASVEIPMHGVKQSLNVSVSCGVLGYEIARAFNQNLEKS